LEQKIESQSGNIGHHIDLYSGKASAVAQGSCSSFHIRLRVGLAWFLNQISAQRFNVTMRVRNQVDRGYLLAFITRLRTHLVELSPRARVENQKQQWEATHKNESIHLRVE